LHESPCLVVKQIETVVERGDPNVALAIDMDVSDEITA
jgi:hypothetical protein